MSKRVFGKIDRFPFWGHKLFLIPIFFSYPLFAKHSSSGDVPEYRAACQKAAENSADFAIFRSNQQIRNIFEITQGDMFAQYVTSSLRLMGHLEAFRKLENFGTPQLEFFPELGYFSATTLRYISLADQILKLTRLREEPVIVEIGPAFGGQCYILSQLHPFSKYYFFDLPEVERLCAKMVESLEMRNTYFIPLEETLPETTVDLVISNYAFSECDKEDQIDYFEKIILQAEQGFFIFNNAPMGGFTIEEFANLLKSHGFQPRIFKELLATAPANKLIVWKKRGQNNPKNR